MNDHQILGRLSFDEELDWYEGKYQLPDGTSLPFTVSVTDQPSHAVAIEEAAVLASKVFLLVPEAKRYAASQLLSDKNEGWLDEEAGEQPLTEDQFTDRLKVQSVGFYSESSVEYFFDDGGLFFGHSVIVSWENGDGFCSAVFSG